MTSVSTSELLTWFQDFSRNKEGALINSLAYFFQHLHHDDRTRATPPPCVHQIAGWGLISVCASWYYTCMAFLTSIIDYQTSGSNRNYWRLLTVKILFPLEVGTPYTVRSIGFRGICLQRNIRLRYNSREIQIRKTSIQRDSYITLLTQDHCLHRTMQDYSLYNTVTNYRLGSQSES